SGAVNAGVVSLARRDYYISAPIDMLGSYQWLVGVPGAHSKITATPAWDQTSASWFSSKFWSSDRNSVETESVSALVLFGGLAGSAGFRTGISGIAFEPLEATKIAYADELSNPGTTRKMCCVYIPYSAEELTYI